MRFSLLLLFLAPVFSYGQVTTSLSADKEFYAYGEQINISFTLFNGSDSTLFYSGSSTCQFHLKFQYIETYPITCTTDDHRYYVYPNQKVNFDIEINPSEFFYPVEDGVQKIALEYLGFKDSVEFSAPQFRAGSFNVSYDSLKSDTIQQLKDSLSAIETDRFIRNKDESDSLISISAIWNVDGFQVDGLVEKLDSTGLFRYVEIYRFFNSSSVMITSNEEKIFDYPFSTTLNQNYPNPFNPTTTFTFELSQPSNVRLSIFNMIGQEVAVLQNNKMSAGSHSINFNGSNLASGMYFYTLKTTNELLSKKFTLIK